MLDPSAVIIFCKEWCLITLHPLSLSSKWELLPKIEQAAPVSSKPDASKSLNLIFKNGLILSLL